MQQPDQRSLMELGMTISTVIADLAKQHLWNDSKSNIHVHSLPVLKGRYEIQQEEYTCKQAKGKNESCFGEVH